MNPPTTPPTLAQLPTNATTYYDDSLRSDVYDYEYLGRDEMGRLVYQPTLNAEPSGSPRALLTYREYVAKVKEFAELSSSIGVQRWTTPTGDVHHVPVRPPCRHKK